MEKKLILLVALLSGISIVAMEEIKETPVLQEASHHEEESLVKIRLTDAQNSETTHEVAIPVRLTKLIGALNKDLIEEPALKGSVFPLPNVTLVQWRVIEPQLERIHDITHDASQAVQLREAIMIDLRKLDVKSLIGVICAADYLEVPILRESACEILKKRALDKISSVSWEELAVLPTDIGNQVIMNNVLIVSEREVAVCLGHECMVTSVCGTKDDKIVSGSYDHTVRIWDIEGNQLAICGSHEWAVTSVCVTSDGKIVSGSEDNTVRVWDIGGNQLAVCRGHGVKVCSVCVTQDGKIVSGSYDRTVRVWDMQGNQLTVCMGHEGVVLSVCVTQDGKIVSGSDDKTLRVWDMEGNQLAVCRGHEGSVISSVCVTKDGKIVSGSHDATVRIWDMEGNQLAVCRGHDGWVNSVCVTQDGKIISGSDDRTVRIWDMLGNQLAECSGHQDWVRSVCVTKDGKIVSGSEDGTVRVWDIALLDRIARMDDNQAQSIWDLLQRISQQAEDKEKLSIEIEKILREDGPVVQANINNNNNNE